MDVFFFFYFKCLEPCFTLAALIGPKRNWPNIEETTEETCVFIGLSDYTNTAALFFLIGDFCHQLEAKK